MNRLEILEDYFVRLYKRYGISNLAYNHSELQVDHKSLRNMIFQSEDFDKEYDSLKDHCCKLFQHLKRGFSLRIKKGWNNDVYVIVE